MFGHKNTFAGICALIFVFSLCQGSECKTRHGQTAFRVYDHSRSSGTQKKKSARQKPRKTARQKKYRVQKGDTLYGIARKHNVRLDDLQRANSVSERKIVPGMLLVIPGPKSAATAAVQRKTVEQRPDAPRFRWPLKKIVSFRRDGDTGVRPIGLIIAGNPDSGVYTSADGVVKKVGQMRGYGKYVMVRHERKYMTVYSNLGEVHVRNGDMLDAGDMIGRVSSANILHFQIDCGGKPQNPLLFLPKKG